MKKLILFVPLFILAAILITACSKSPNANDANSMKYTDTLGLAAFQSWKAQNELKDPSIYYNQGSESAVKPAATKTVVKKVYVPSKTVAMNSESQYPAKKKGWSRKAKGAAIGGGAGAVIGAIVNKKSRVKGGVIGGLLGAGIGYVVGNEMDRKKGR